MTIRPGRLSDLAYVRDSWLKCDRTSPAARDEGLGYMARQKSRIRRILARATLSVAVSVDDEDAIVGWAVYETEPPTLYYVHVRADARQLNIASRLLAPLGLVPVTFTHRPSVRGALPIPASWRYSRDPNHQ